MRSVQETGLSNRERASVPRLRSSRQVSLPEMTQPRHTCATLLASSSLITGLDDLLLATKDFEHEVVAILYLNNVILIVTRTLTSKDTLILDAW